MGRPNPRRYYPVGPLAEALGVTPVEALNRAGVTDATRKGHRYLEVGLLPKAADRLATRLGFHPAEVWPSWVEDTIADLGSSCAECGTPFLPGRRDQVYCDVTCRRRVARRRYEARKRNTPEGREANRRKVAAWRESLGSAAVRAQRAKQARRSRAWLEANREHVQAQRAAYRRERYAADPEYRARVLAKQRERDARRAAAAREDTAA